MDERLETWTSAAVNALYAGALVVMILGTVPQLRDPLLAAWRAQVHAWRHGRWLGPVSPPPGAWRGWLTRQDLPQERA